MSYLKTSLRTPLIASNRYFYSAFKVVILSIVASSPLIAEVDIVTLDDFAKAGYSCVIYPVSTLRIASQAVDNFLKDLKDNGT